MNSPELFIKNADVSIITAISGFYLDIAVNRNINMFLRINFEFIGIFYLTGEPIPPHLPRSDPFSVDRYSFTNQISQIKQSWLVNNPGNLGMMEYG